MNAAESLAPTISEPLGWDEICARYPDQHVWLVEIDWIHPRGLAFRTARVIGHSTVRREAFEHAHRWRPRYRELAHRFTGHSPLPYIRPALILDDEPRDAIRHRR